MVLHERCNVFNTTIPYSTYRGRLRNYLSVGAGFGTRLRQKMSLTLARQWQTTENFLPCQTPQIPFGTGDLCQAIAYEKPWLSSSPSYSTKPLVKHSAIT